MWSLYNAVFGKTCENVRNRKDIHLTKGREKAQKWINKPNFKSFKIFDENLLACHMIKNKIKMNRPSYVGQAILDISKTVMYEFHYNVIKKMYGDKAQLLMTDTDSFCYHIQTENVYKDMAGMDVEFDTSNYSKNHPLYSEKYKKVIGLMKDETGGIPIAEFVGLRAKLYS